MVEFGRRGAIFAGSAETELTSSPVLPQNAETLGNNRLDFVNFQFFSLNYIGAKIRNNWQWYESDVADIWHCGRGIKYLRNLISLSNLV